MALKRFFARGYRRVFVASLLVVFSSFEALADSELETKFQDMFVTAGYSAAAGAAVGAAILTFQDQPTKHLRFISIGASLGFLSGTALGAWYTVIPAFVDNKRPSIHPFPSSDSPTKFVMRPWIDLSSQRLAGIEAGAIIASF
jgi:hypothetical protein